MPVTDFMNLTLPIPSITLGVEWAEELNAAFEVVDLHDHSSGKGVPITPAGLNIDANLDFQENKAYNLFSTQYDDMAVPLTGASNANSVHTSSGDLYFTNGSGTAVQITSGGSVVSVPASASSFEYTTANSNLVIDASDTFVVVALDTTSSRTVTLPLASAVASGRIYVLKDATGDSETNPCTLTAAGSDLIDGAASQPLNSDYGSIMIIGDGTSNWRTI